MSRFRIRASVVPLAVIAFLSDSQLFAGTHPCIAVADGSVQLTSLPWQSDLNVSFITNPAKATVRVQIIDSAENVDFAVIDGAGMTEDSGCHTGRPPQVSISRGFSTSDQVIYMTPDGPADHRIFVQSKTFSMLDAAVLIVGARIGHAKRQFAAL